VWVSWVNQNLTPLFWVLIALVIVDILMNIKSEDKQFHKLGSAFSALGIPAVISNSFMQGNGEIGKIVVLLLCLGYIQVVVPQLRDKLIGFFPKNEDKTVVGKSIDEIDSILEAKIKAKIEEYKAQSDTKPKDDQGGGVR
jgi:hypothetical protein